MKIDKEFILDTLSYIAEEGNYEKGEEGYSAYEKFKNSKKYKIFLEKELQEEDYSEFINGYNEILSRYNMSLNEYSDFEPDLTDEESEYCNTFALSILDKYVTNKFIVRERKLNKILKR
jgi:hypothetical protein